MHIESLNSTHFKVNGIELPRGYMLKFDGKWIYLVHFETQIKDEGYLGNLETTSVNGQFYTSFKTLNDVAAGVIYSSAAGGIQTYDATNAFEEDTVIIKDDKIFIANADIPANTAFAIGTTGATWRELSKVSALETRGSFDTHAIMVANITDAQTDDLAVVETTTGVRFINQKLSGLWRYNGTEWQHLGAVPTKHGAQAHDAAAYYYEGNLIYHDGKLQRCKANIAPKAFDQDDWDVVSNSTGSNALYFSDSDYIYISGLRADGTWYTYRTHKLIDNTKELADVANNALQTTQPLDLATVQPLNYS